MASDHPCPVSLFLRRSTNEDGTPCLLVTDAQGRANRPLSYFVRYAQTRYAPTTVSVYVHAMLHYFSWLIGKRRRWDSNVAGVRALCAQFLCEVLRCHARERRGQFVAVHATVANPAEVRAFLAAARAFYRFAIDAGLMPSPTR
jgi:hypothetical protein